MNTDIRNLPDPKTLLPARWQAYAKWLAGQTNPPKSYREHPTASAEELACLKKDFEQHAGCSLGKYVRLKRVAHLLAQTPQAGAPAAVTLTTQLGQMLAVFSRKGLCLLEFPERKGVENELLAIQKAFQTGIAWGESPFTAVLQQELDDYFAGRLTVFQTPLDPVGTPFQQQVWRALQAIPYGETRSYKAQAEFIGKPKAVRAVAAANGQNKISILIPCHRVIGSDGSLVGYAGGLARKRALLTLEGCQYEMPV